MNLLEIYKNQIENQKSFLILGIFISLFFFIVCKSDIYGQQGDINSQEGIDNARDYRIGPGDVIDVLVSKQETLTRLGIRVSNQGTIQLSMIDDEIFAACQTERELANQIKEKYRKYLLNPQVIVAVKEYNSTPISLIGAVITPTRLQFQRPMRLLEVLTIGNGPSANAGTTIQIIRSPISASCEEKNAPSLMVKANEELITFQLAETLKAIEQSNPFVQAGDIIRVVEAEKVKIHQAFIIGNVKTAKTIDLDDPVTLTQAIAMAGGTAEGAQTEKIKVSRREIGSLNKTELIVNLKEISKQKAEDFLLQPNDIVEVPGPSKTQKFLRDIFRTTVPMITRIPVGGVIPY